MQSCKQGVVKLVTMVSANFGIEVALLQDIEFFKKILLEK